MHLPDDRTAEPQSGISRRGLLRGVAWAAPVIVVATAAPGASASGGDIQVAWTNFTVDSIYINGDDWGGVVGNFDIQRINDVWNGPILSALTATVTFETRLGLTGVLGSVDISGSSAGWSVQSASIGVTYTVYSFAWNGSMAPYGDTGVLHYSIPTTIVAEVADMVPYTAAGYANSPEVTAAINATDTVS